MPLDPNSNSTSAEQVSAGSLTSALLLAFSGGSLDAFIYLNHGHVFAAAMTGNGVLLGVTILHHDWMQAIHHLLPILAVVVGAFAARVLATVFRHHGTTIGLSCEIAVMFAASWLPGTFPDLAYVPIIALVAAYQVASFRTADTYSYNSTFMTGNLRTAVDGLYESLTPATRSSGLRKFRELSLIVLCFLTGATTGAILAPRLFNHTLWLVITPLTIVLTLALSRSNAKIPMSKL